MMNCKIIKSIKMVAGNDYTAVHNLPFVVKNCRSGSMKSNPRPFSDEEVAALLERLI